MIGHLVSFSHSIQRLLAELRKIPKAHKLVLLVGVDGLLAAGALATAYFIRLGHFGSPETVVLYPLVVGSTILMYWICGMYGIVIRFSDVGEIPRGIRAATLSAFMCLAIMFILVISPNPRSLWLLYGALLFVGVFCSSRTPHTERCCAMTVVDYVIMCCEFVVPTAAATVVLR